MQVTAEFEPLGVRLEAFEILVTQACKHTLGLLQELFSKNFEA